MSNTSNCGADALRPRRLQSLKVSAYSQLSWSALIASGQCATKLPDQCSRIQTLLNQTPSIPSALEVPDSIVGNNLVLEGYSRWSVSSRSQRMGSECALDASKASCPRSAYIGVSRPSTCVLSGGFIPQWSGFQSLAQSSGNHLALCVLGWSYVLSGPVT
ncbi:hypothetical protein ASPACDRAFT_125807 [Aspergillus aculeatus ATCC 16872]|uniref:Uncharacterized protein n=1 Tax=Aspergillus aculeatus (strain ATCC 16872 / CBS 172.66 / WB 5094) TaxID=690307 RepID=A0A1L9WJB2_ASPA1|nr:uncharacterized protein ASPACDRAFT_125807 [Aspergillus aculeatus ATCC 16872]OJJ96244.1 hypothetical protein ASPACDRAFT_125807 [Aspergillus aculeatus ATCC 16872]